MTKKVVPMPQENDDNMTLIIDRVIGDDENPIIVRADLRYLMTDQQDYFAKLLESRRLPRDPDSIAPDDPLIPIVLKLPHIAAMPDKTRAEQDAKSRAVLSELATHYNKHIRQAESDAIMLAITMENEFVDPPTPYEDSMPTNRKRPGLVDLPEPKRDLNNPVEARLKQLLDALAKSPRALQQLQEATTFMAIDINRRLQMTDRDGFRR